MNIETLQALWPCLSTSERVKILLVVISEITSITRPIRIGVSTFVFSFAILLFLPYEPISMGIAFGGGLSIAIVLD